MKKRLFSIVFIALMAICLAPMLSNISYADEDPSNSPSHVMTDGETYKVNNGTDYLAVKINKPGTYYLEGSSNRVHVIVSTGGSGDVYLHLKDGLSITPGALATSSWLGISGMEIKEDGGTVHLISEANANSYIKGYLFASGIMKNGNKTKLVFETANPGDKSTWGTIRAHAQSGVSSPGIGGCGGKKGDGQTCGNIYFESGNVVGEGGVGPAIGSIGEKLDGLYFNGANVTANSGDEGAGIGTAGTTDIGTITINSGKVSAYANEGSAIGGGYFNMSGPNLHKHNIEKIVINGGTVVAISDKSAAIGNSPNTFCEKIVINGGDVTAVTRSTKGACAIGGGYKHHTGDARCATVYINGGEITATAKGKNGSGIGPGKYARSTSGVYISGGQITAKGGKAGYAIGGGSPGKTNINISGGTTVIDDENGNGIGSFNNDGLRVQITGGSMFCKKTSVTPVDDKGIKLEMAYVGLDNTPAGSKVSLDEIKLQNAKYDYGSNDMYSSNNADPTAKLNLSVAEVGGTYAPTYVYPWIPSEATVFKATTTYSSNSHRLYGSISKDTKTGIISGLLAEGTDITLTKQEGSTGDDGKAEAGYKQTSLDLITVPGMKDGYRIDGYKLTDGTLIANKYGMFEKDVSGYTTLNMWTYKGNPLKFNPIYVPIKYTIKFDSNVPANASTTIEGSMGDQSEIVYDVPINLTANGYSLSGYYFNGWNTKADGTGDKYADGAEVSKLTTKDDDIVTLYAQWVPLQYKVTFDKGYGTGDVMSPQTLTFDKSETLSANTYTAPENQTFLGWLKSGSVGKLYADQAQVENLVAASVLDQAWIDAGKSIENYTMPQVTLGAQWISKNNFRICILVDDKPYNSGGNNVRVTLEQSGTTGQVIEETPDANGVISKDLEGLSGTYDILVEGKATGKQWSADSEATVYLRYYSYSAVANDDKIGKASAGLGDGAHQYPFDSTASYTLEGDKVVITATDFAQGYTFNRWSAMGVDPTYVSGTTSGTKDATIALNGPTLQGASSRPIQYNVQFDGNGNTGGSMLTVENLTYGETFNLPANEFTRTGYNFVGWSTTAGGSKQYDDGQSVSNLSTSDMTTVTLFAVWEPYNYTVNFDGNCADGKMESMSCQVGRPATLPTCTLKREGYTFLGWNATPSSDEVIYKDNATTTDFSEIPGLVIKDGTELTLYAVWAHDSYTVEYHSNYGNGDVVSFAEYCGEGIYLNADIFTRKGYTLIEWNTRANGSGKSYKPGKEYYDLAKKGEKITLYAIWKKGSISIGGFDTGDPNNILLCIILSTLAAIGCALTLYRRTS